MPRRTKPKRTFGHVEQVHPSNRYRARFTGPDLARHTAPGTFDTYGDAEAWLAEEAKRVKADGEAWVPPRERILEAQQRRKLEELTLRDYADSWLSTRKTRGRSLAPRTVEHYRKILDRLILPTLGDVALTAITSEAVLAWYETATTPEGELMATRPKLRADAYVLLKSILSSAADPAQTGGARIPFNPCAIRGAGTAERKSRTEIASVDDLDAIAAAMPEPYRLMVLLAAWCALRSGEVRELRRKDIDTTTGTLRVERQVVRTQAGMIVSPPKSAAGRREIPIPQSLLPAVRRHLLQHAQAGREGLLFPSPRGAHLSTGSFADMFDAARRTVGRPDLRFHDLRHTGLTFVAHAGATLAELQAWAGHSTAQAALRYQHATRDRMDLIAGHLDAMRGRPE